MAGHSKWANIKHRKGAADAKRAKVFSKLIKEITVAARLGGSDLDANPRLRLAVDKAKAQSMPKDNMERAIKKGTGEIDGGAIEEVAYEGYGPEGVALIVECATDNKNRTVAEIRHIFSRKGGNLGENGSVAWMFEKKGLIRFAAEGLDEDHVFEVALEAGAEDVQKEGDQYVITTSYNDFHSVTTALSQTDLPAGEAGLEMIAKNEVAIGNAEAAQKVITLVDALEDNDDVQNVWANADIDDSVLESLE